jgi:hypothetical protein
MGIQAFICLFGMCTDDNSSTQTIVIRGESAYVQGFPEFKVSLNDYKGNTQSEVLQVKCTLQNDFTTKCENGITFKLKGT